MGQQTDIESPNAQGGACMMIEQVVLFDAHGQRYALPIDQVAEIQQIVAFSPAPSHAPGLLGMFDLRGTVIPAVDLRAVLGEPAAPFHVEMPMIICRTSRGLAALVVDSVRDVLGLPTGCVQEAPHMHAHADKMIGVARLDDGLAYVFDADRLLAGAVS